MTDYLVELVENKLYSLSRLTSDEISKFLYEKGIRGNKTRSLSCPVAKYINMALPEKYHVSVSGSLLFINAGPVFLKSVKVDGSVREFINRFDNGSYPMLLEL